MAKTAKTQSKVQKDADAARAAFQKAKEAHDKNANVTNKSAMDKAQEVMRHAVKLENRERFIAVGTSRTKKARAAIRQLVKVANPKTYDFTATEGENITKLLMQAVDEVRKAFTATGKTADAGDDISIIAS